MSHDGAVFAKAAGRLIPFMGLLYLVNYLDRVNIGFAALTMNKDIGLGAEAFGWGAGIFFLGYFIFEIPSNLMLVRFGARRWIFRIMLSWGLVSMAMVLVRGPASFYFVRFLLGLAEAGFFPGMMLYLCYWFPASSRARFNSYFLFAIPLASAIGSPLSSLLLELDGVAQLHGWQWLFLLEGLPACALAFLVLFYLPDGPGDAKWLSDGEKRVIAIHHAREAVPPQGLMYALLDARVWLIAAADFGIIISLYGFQFWLPQIVKAMGFSNLQTGFVVAIPYIVCAVVMVAWARSSDFRGERIWHTILAALFASAGFAAAALLHSHVLELIALSIAAVGVYCALVSIWTLPTSFLGGTAAAGGIALINSFANMGGFVGPYAVGWLKQATGGYEAGMALMAGGLLMTVALVFGLSRIAPLPVPVPALE